MSQHKYRLWQTACELGCLEHSSLICCRGLIFVLSLKVISFGIKHPKWLLLLGDQDEHSLLTQRDKAWTCLSSHDDIHLTGVPQRFKQWRDGLEYPDEVRSTRRWHHGGSHSWECRLLPLCQTSSLFCSTRYYSHCMVRWVMEISFQKTIAGMIAEKKKKKRKRDAAIFLAEPQCMCSYSYTGSSVQPSDL